MNDTTRDELVCARCGVPIQLNGRTGFYEATAPVVEPDHRRLCNGQRGQLHQPGGKDIEDTLRAAGYFGGLRGDAAKWAAAEAALENRRQDISSDENDGRFDYLPPHEHDMAAFGRVIPDESTAPQDETRFWLDEAGLAGLAENYPVEDDHDALLAIETAILGNGDFRTAVIRGGCEVAVELLANGDGEIDGYRVLIHPSSDLDDPWIAGHIERVIDQDPGPGGNGGYYDTAQIIRDAVQAANTLLEWSER